MDNLITSFQDHIRDRLSSPLAAAFAASWGLFNYRFLLVLFSSKSVEEKLIFIDQVHFSSLQQIWLNGITYPLAAAVGYIFLYPPISRFVMAYLLGQQRLARELRHVIVQETPLSKEGAAELRSQFNSRIAELESEVNRRQQTVYALRQNEEALEAQLEDGRKEIKSLTDKKTEAGLNYTVLQSKCKEVAEKLEMTESQLQSAVQKIAQLNQSLADRDEQHVKDRSELIQKNLMLTEELSQIRTQLNIKNAELMKINPMTAGLMSAITPKIASIEPLGSMFHNGSLLDSDN